MEVLFRVPIYIHTHVARWCNGEGVWAWNQQVTSSNPARMDAAWQPWASCSHLCASVTKQYNLVLAKGRWYFEAGEVTAGLAESNGSLPPVGWLTVACGLTACTPGSAPGPTLGIEYGKPLHLPFFMKACMDEKGLLIGRFDRKKNIIKSTIWSIVLHSAETWTLS